MHVAGAGVAGPGVDGRVDDESLPEPQAARTRTRHTAAERNRINRECKPDIAFWQQRLTSTACRYGEYGWSQDASSPIGRKDPGTLASSQVNPRRRRPWSTARPIVLRGLGRRFPSWGPNVRLAMPQWTNRRVLRLVRWIAVGLALAYLLLPYSTRSERCAPAVVSARDYLFPVGETITDCSVIAIRRIATTAIVLPLVLLGIWVLTRIAFGSTQENTAGQGPPDEHSSEPAQRHPRRRGSGLFVSVLAGVVVAGSALYAFLPFRVTNSARTSPFGRAEEVTTNCAPAILSGWGFHPYDSAGGIDCSDIAGGRLVRLLMVLFVVLGVGGVRYIMRAVRSGSLPPGRRWLAAAALLIALVALAFTLTPLDSPPDCSPPLREMVPYESNRCFSASRRRVVLAAGLIGATLATAVIAVQTSRLSNVTKLET